MMKDSTDRFIKNRLRKLFPIVIGGLISGIIVAIVTAFSGCVMIFGILMTLIIPTLIYLFGSWLLSKEYKETQNVEKAEDAINMILDDKERLQNMNEQITEELENKRDEIENLESELERLEGRIEELEMRQEVGEGLEDEEKT